MPFEISNMYDRITMYVWLEPEPDEAHGTRRLLYRGPIPRDEAEIDEYELDWGGYMHPEIEYVGEGLWDLVFHVFKPTSPAK